MLLHQAFAPRWGCIEYQLMHGERTEIDTSIIIHASGIGTYLQLDFPPRDRGKYFKKHAS